MRKMFYIVSLLIVASMLLAACGGAATTEEPAAPAAPANQEPAAPAATSEPAAAPTTMEYTSKDPTTLVVATIGEPETLDPALAYETAGGEIIQNVYETLVFYDGEHTDKFVPQLAESWEVSDDGSVYTFKIRSGVKFHDGADLTASDVAYSFQRGLLFGGYSGPQWLLAEPFFGVGNDDITSIVDDFASADDRESLIANDPATLLAACETVKSKIVADDAAGTVTMTLAQPWGPFIATIANGWGSVLNQAWAVSNGAWDGSCDTWQNYYAEPSETDPLTTIMNGTGPFMLDHWTQGEELVLTRNDNYWREPAKLERVVIKSIDEWGTRFAMLQAGDADIVTVPSENRSQVDAMVGSMRIYDLAAGSYGDEVAVCGYDASQQGQAKFTPCAAGEEGTGGPIRLYIGRPAISSQDLFMTFNIAESSNYVGSGQLDGNGIPYDFFSDVHVRKAFAYCFDWDIYISDVYDGEAIQQPVLARQGMPGYEGDFPVYSYDPAQCEAEFKLADLDKDGIPAGDDPEGDLWTTGFRLQALYNQGNTSRQVVSEILSANVADVNDLFVIETVGLPWPTFLRTLRASEAPYFVSGWLEDIHDPHNWYQPYMVGTYAGRQRMPADLKSQFQDILNRGVSATDSEERAAIYHEANVLYYDQVPTVLLATPTSHGFDQRWVKGTVLNPIFSGNYFYPMYKD